MYHSKALVLGALSFIYSFGLRSQVIPASASIHHHSGVDYSQMPDTTLIILGSFSLHTWQFRRADSAEGPQFAKAELRVKDHRLKGVEMMDNNSGCQLKMTFDKEGGFKSHRFRCKDEWATNAPHFFPE